MQHLLDKLNPEQLGTVAVPAQSALIPAGVLPGTLTNKAAKEMTAQLFD